MRRAFVSYHHGNDQAYKNALVEIAERNRIFVDWSVDIGDISDDLDDQAVRRRIRDEYLRDSTVTILLVGLETRYRKHVDWELKSSMIDGAVNRRSGVVVISLPSTGCNYYTAVHDGEKDFYPDCNSWVSCDRAEYERRYPYLPERIIDNLVAPRTPISVTNWNRIADNPDFLRFLIEAAAEGREECEYDCSRPMRMRDGSPRL